VRQHPDIKAAAAEGDGKHSSEFLSGGNREMDDFHGRIKARLGFKKARMMPAAKQDASS
jgi:hypothetical protein